MHRIHRVRLLSLLAVVAACLFASQQASAQLIAPIQPRAVLPRPALSNPYAGVPIVQRPYREGHFIGNTIRRAINRPQRIPRRMRRW